MALIKCSECNKEISDTVKRCPHCGFKMKSSFDFKGLINKIVSNKKILFSIIGVLLVIVIIVCISMFTGVKEHKDSKKLKAYLEGIGYNCMTYEAKDNSDVCTYCHYCTHMMSNGVSQVVEINYRTNNAIYRENAYSAYELSIQSSDYNSESKHTGVIRYTDLVENKKFTFFPQNVSYFTVGENVDCDRYKYGDSKKICPDVISDVNTAMRLFESYCVGAGVPLN